MRLATIAALGALLLLVLPGLGGALVAVERDVTVAAPETVTAGTLFGVVGEARVLIGSAAAPRAPPSERVTLRVDGAPMAVATTDLMGSGSYRTGVALPRGAYELDVVLSTREAGEVRSRALHVRAVEPPGVVRSPAMALGATPAQAIVSWQAPLDDGGSPISAYVVEGSAGSTWTPVATTSSATLQATHAPPVGEVWSYRVAARNFAGRGAWTTAVPVEPAPDAVTGLAATANASAYFLSWTPPAGDVLGYVVTRAGGPYGPVSRVTTAPSFVDDVGRRTVAWTYDVRAMHAAAVGPASSVQVQPAGPPSPPTFPAATLGATPGRIHLSWSPPLDDGGAPPEAYRIESGDGVSWTLVGVAAAPAFAADIDAAVGNVSLYRVFAEQYAGRSDPAQFVASATAPGAVEGLTATREGATALVSWSPPASGGPVWMYRVTRTDASGSATWFTDALSVADATDGSPGSRSYAVAAMHALAVGPSSAAAVAFP